MSRRHYTFNREPEPRTLGAARMLNVSSAKYDGDWHSVPHTHNHVELFYITGGRGQFLIEDQLYPVNTNHLVIINPNVTHTEVSLNAQPLEYIVLGIDGIELSVSGNTEGGFCILDHLGSMEISSCIRNILRERELKQPGYEDVCQAFMEILVIRLMRNAGFSAQSSVSATSGNRQCAAVRRYIDQHFKEPLDLEQLAREAHMSKFYLSHAFKREYGVSPINYMLSRRLEESKYLLVETDLSIAQIAQLLGFSSLSYFSQIFRRTQSISPKEYRQNSRAVKELK